MSVSFLLDQSGCVDHGISISSSKEQPSRESITKILSIPRQKWASIRRIASLIVSEDRDCVRSSRRILVRRNLHLPASFISRDVTTKSIAMYGIEAKIELHQAGQKCSKSRPSSIAMKSTIAMVQDIAASRQRCRASIYSSKSPCPVTCSTAGFSKVRSNARMTDILTPKYTSRSGLV